MGSHTEIAEDFFQFLSQYEEETEGEVKCEIIAKLLSTSSVLNHTYRYVKEHHFRQNFQKTMHIFFIDNLKKKSKF